MTTMESLKRIEKLRASSRKAAEPNLLPTLYGHENIVFVIRAFDVMREMAVEANGGIGHFGDHMHSDLAIDQAFEERMKAEMDGSV